MGTEQPDDKEAGETNECEGDIGALCGDAVTIQERAGFILVSMSYGST